MRGKAFRHLIIGLLLAPGLSFSQRNGIIVVGGDTPGVTEPMLVVQKGHDWPVTCMAFCPNDGLLATGDMKGTIKLWHVRTGKLLRSMVLAEDEVDQIEFTPNGSRIAVFSASGRFNLWTIDGDLLHAGWKSPPIRSIAFDPTGAKLYLDSRPRNGSAVIFVFDGYTGRQTDSLAGASYSSIALPLRHSIRWGFAEAREGGIVGSNGNLVSLTYEYFSDQSRGDPKHPFYWQDRSTNTLTVMEGVVEKLPPTTFPIGTPLRSLAISPRGDFFGYVTSDGAIHLRAIGDTVSLPRVLYDTKPTVYSSDRNLRCALAFSNDGSLLAASSMESIVFYDVRGGKELLRFTAVNVRFDNVSLTHEGTGFLASRSDGNIDIWDIARGGVVKTVSAGVLTMRGVAADRGYNEFLVIRGSLERRLRPDLDSLTLVSVDGNEKYTVFSKGFHHELAGVVNVPGKNQCVVWGFFDRVKIWDFAARDWEREFRWECRSYGIPHAVSLSSDGRLMGVRSESSVLIFDMQEDEMIADLAIRSSSPGYDDLSIPDGLAFSHGGDRLALPVSQNKILTIWSTETKRVLREIDCRVPVHQVAFSPDDSFIVGATYGARAVGYRAEMLGLWDVTTGELKSFSYFESNVKLAAFLPDGGGIVVGLENGTTMIMEPETLRPKATLYSLAKGEWAVVTPGGPFDASPGARKMLHFMYGEEPIELEQLKERYYEPGLLAKLTGFNTEHRREFPPLSGVKLFPKVTFLHPPSSQTKICIDVINRGGGIGQVQVFVDDMEVVADARPRHFDPGKPKARLTVDLREWLRKGAENEIKVVAWNSEGYLSSRGFGSILKAPGKAGSTPPSLYAIVGGVSEYADSSLNLRFASKDADAMAHALALGGSRLFGADKVHVQLLSTSGKPGTMLPSKSNFRKAFESLSKATPTDILVIYLAGHGISVQKDREMFCYLTSDARRSSISFLSDPAVLSQMTITDNELVAWARKSRIRKKVVIFDACGAGAAADRLTDRRDIPGDQVRAIERLKDRTGLHVLMGCASDAVSYEATQYGQGLLTYSLLQGMRGAALRDDKFADVSKLFQHAAEQVPLLAKNIGGVQKPEIRVPSGTGTSFDIGEFLGDDKQAIHLAQVKPMILRPVLLNRDELIDNLHLTRALKDALREESYVVSPGHTEPSIVYVDADELPDAFSVSGTYNVSGDEVHTTLVLKHGDQNNLQLVVKGSKTNLPEFVARLCREIVKAVTIQ